MSAVDLDLTVANAGHACATLEEAVEALRRQLGNAELALRERQAERRRASRFRTTHNGRSVLVEIVG